LERLDVRQKEALRAIGDGDRTGYVFDPKNIELVTLLATLAKECCTLGARLHLLAPFTVRSN
jgi:hypothetical protein